MSVDTHSRPSGLTSAASRAVDPWPTGLTRTEQPEVVTNRQLMVKAYEWIQAHVWSPLDGDGRPWTPPTQVALEQGARWIARFWRQARRGGEGIGYLAPQVFQLPRGGFQLEWCALGSEVEVAIDGDGSSTLLVSAPSLDHQVAQEFASIGEFLLPAAASEVFSSIVDHVTLAVTGG
jgi:hypothetical protein